MAWIKYWKAQLKKMTLFDISVLKICVLLIGMIIGALVAGFVKNYMVYFIAGAAITYIWLLLRFFPRKPSA